MKREIRAIAVATCITAAALIGGQSAFAGYAGLGERAGAGPGEMHRQKKGQRGGDFFKEMAAELKLTDQQKAQAREIFEKGRAEHKPLMEALRDEKRQLQTLIHAGSTDEGAIRAQSAKVAAIQADLAVKRGEKAGRLAAILSPEQAAKLKEMQGKGKGFPGARCDDSLPQ